MSRRFLTEEEFEELRSKLEYAHLESAKLFPVFDHTTTAITDEQAEILYPYTQRMFTPFYWAIRNFDNQINACVGINHACLP